MSRLDEDNFYITIHYFSTKTSIHIAHFYTHLVCNTSYTNNIIVSVNGMAPILDPQKMAVSWHKVFHTPEEVSTQPQDQQHSARKRCNVWKFRKLSFLTFHTYWRNVEHALYQTYTKSITKFFLFFWKI